MKIEKLTPQQRAAFLDEFTFRKSKGGYVHAYTSDGNLYAAWGLWDGPGTFPYWDFLEVSSEPTDS